MATRMPKFIQVLMLLVISLAAACNPVTVSQTPHPTQTPPTATATSHIRTATTIDYSSIYPAAFATYPSIQVDLPDSFAGGGYALPINLNRVEGLEDKEFNPAQLAMLSRNGFVVIPTEPGEYYREFYQLYEFYRYQGTPLFITTDSIYHIYHLIFDKMLRDLERDYFIETLSRLTSTMLSTTHLQHTLLKGTSLEEPALRNMAFFGVAAQLLGLPDSIPSEAAALVEAEVALINAADGTQVSPIWDRDDLAADKKLIEDYTQYIPRGHYTRSEELKMYFRTMMWYGRLTFRLKDDFETRRALLLVEALRSTASSSGTPATTLWEKIYDPTVFIVGKADDLSYYEYGALSDEIFGVNPNLMLFADETLFAEFMEAAQNLPPPQINSMWVWIWEDQGEATKGFRFMGQRFTLDAYVFGQLIWRRVGTMDNPRGLPKGLDFLAATGSAEAYAILQDLGETQYENYDAQMAKVQNEISLLDQDTWTQNLYWSWLYTLQPLTQPKDSRFPQFMQTQAWQRKELQTALGSWTELKHDTILYAKQVMAEMGGGGLEEIPRGYVEPNPEAYARLRALAIMTREGLMARDLLSETTASNLENLISELEFLQTVSEKELAGIPLSADDYNHILFFGGILEQFTLAAADTETDIDRDLSDKKAALIADVATGFAPGITGLVALEEAIGQPAFIYVILPDQPWRIAQGAVFTYFEFAVPIAERMTDEDWQALVETGDIPPQPEWTEVFIAP